MPMPQCGECRFWQPVPGDGDCPVDGVGYGWCRNGPPAIVDHMARMTIPHLGNRQDNYDPDNVATVENVHSATLHPATFRTDWCGRFEALWRDGANQGAWDVALGIYKRLRAAADATAKDDAAIDAAVDAYHDAMDVLLVETRAPDLGAVADKLDLLRERFDGFTTPDAHWDALKADLAAIDGEGR